MSDITVILDRKYNIDWKHTIEKELDKVFVPLGFTRSGTCVNIDGTTVISYRQFGICGVED